MKLFLIFFLSSITATFIKTSEPQEAQNSAGYFENFLKTIFFNSQVDFCKFDFHGNEIDRPDLTLEKGHFLCYKTGNVSLLFRKFAGLIKESSYYINFWRVDELKARYYPIRERQDNHHQDNHQDYHQDNHQDSYYHQDLHPKLAMLPELLLSDEKLILAESFVIDLALTVIPSLQGSLIDFPADLAGILILMFLKHVDDFEGYYEDFKEFYFLMQKFASLNFELTTVTRSLGASSIIEELFQLAVKLDLPYTLEVFYAMDLVDFGNNRLLKFVLETACCPLVINRFFDFIPWNDGLIDGIPKIHFVYENYSEYLEFLFEYESARINWRVVDDTCNLTVLGKLLPNISKTVFSEGNSIVKNSSRVLLKEFLSHPTPKESAGTFITAEKDILMKCYENELEGLRLLVEYADNVVDIQNVIEDYLMRVFHFWKSNDSVNLIKIFKYLVKKNNNSTIIFPLLIEAFDFFNERLSKEASESDSRSDSRNSTSSNQSGKSIKFNRSSSGTDFFKFLFIDTGASSITAAPKSPRSPKAKQNLEMMKFIAQEAERLVHRDDLVTREIISHCNIIILSYGHI